MSLSPKLIPLSLIILSVLSQAVPTPTFTQNSFQSGFTYPFNALFASNGYFDIEWIDTATGAWVEGPTSSACANQFLREVSINQQGTVDCINSNFDMNGVFVSETNANLTKSLFSFQISVTNVTFYDDGVNWYFTSQTDPETVNVTVFNTVSNNVTWYSLSGFEDSDYEITSFGNFDGTLVLSYNLPSVQQSIFAVAYIGNSANKIVTVLTYGNYNVSIYQYDMSSNFLIVDPDFQDVQAASFAGGLYTGGEMASFVVYIPFNLTHFILARETNSVGISNMTFTLTYINSELNLISAGEFSYFGPTPRAIQYLQPNQLSIELADYSFLYYSFDSGVTYIQNNYYPPALFSNGSKVTFTTSGYFIQTGSTITFVQTPILDQYSDFTNQILFGIYSPNFTNVPTLPYNYILAINFEQNSVNQISFPTLPILGSTGPISLIDVTTDLQGSYVVTYQDQSGNLYFVNKNGTYQIVKLTNAPTIITTALDFQSGLGTIIYSVKIVGGCFSTNFYIHNGTLLNVQIFSNTGTFFGQKLNSTHAMLVNSTQTQTTFNLFQLPSFDLVSQMNYNAQVMNTPNTFAVFGVGGNGNAFEGIGFVVNFHIVLLSANNEASIVYKGVSAEIQIYPYGPNGLAFTSIQNTFYNCTIGQVNWNLQEKIIS